MTTIRIPGDSAARSVGADVVAAEIARLADEKNLNVALTRTGSRGLYWLEPLVEVVSNGRCAAYGPVDFDSVASLFEARFFDHGAHPLGVGDPANIPWLANQTRTTFRRVGLTDPLSLGDYVELGGFKALASALSEPPQALVDEIKKSGLRGRGGAAFPTGTKWQTVLDQPDPEKYVACNADEGDSGTFADRMIMESDPFVLIEGMALAGLATGASRGVIYVRAEYPQAISTLEDAIAIATEAGWLGDDLRRSGKSFQLELMKAAGSYICGEETAMLESLEGKRGMVRVRPPMPALAGLFGRPTAVNNVVTLAAVPDILHLGAEQYRALGSGDSRGTLTVQLAGNVKRGGLIELPFGHTLHELLYEYGGGTASGRPIRAVQVGGPLGAYVPPERFNTPLDYEAFDGIGAMLGHGGIVVFDDSVNMAQQARFSMEFCAIESCGKCTPCRIGSVRGVEVIDRICANENRDVNLDLLRDLCDTMTEGSLCAMGGLTPNPVLSALNYFPEDFSRPIGSPQRPQAR